VSQKKYCQNEATNRSGNTRAKGPVLTACSARPTLLSIFHKSGTFPDGLLPRSSVDRDRVRARRKLTVSRRLTSAGCVHGVAIAVIAHQAHIVAVARAPLENLEGDGCWYSVAKVNDVDLSHKKSRHVCLSRGTIKMRRRN